MNGNFKYVINSIRDRTDIVQIISEYVKLDQNHKGLCPFHEEKTPSFSVNPKGQFFYCFGCGKGGDVFRFLELYEKKTFMEVLRELADRNNIPIPNSEEKSFDELKINRHVSEVLAETARYYQACITDDIKEYLIRERKYSEETITQFQIGYADGGLKKHLINMRNIPEEICLKAGILKQSNDGISKDFFYRRIIFPVLKRGMVVNLSGRSIDDTQPKYLHLAGEINYLYNESALYNDEVFITEGITDCLSAIQSGYPAAGIFGSLSFKEEYSTKFSHCKRIYVCLDADDAGRKGAEKIATIIGDRARIIELPNGLDLNDYFKEHSKADFDDLKSSAKGIIKYKLSLIPENSDKTELPSKLESILEMLARLDKAKAEPYLRYDIKVRFGLSNQDIDAYRSRINELRDKDTDKPKLSQSSSNSKDKYIALFDELIEIVEYEGRSAFLINDQNGPVIQFDIKINGDIFYPPPKNKIPWLLPKGEEVKRLYEIEKNLTVREADGALFDDIVEYLKTISELPDEGYYSFLAAWVMHTYLLEPIQYSPMICLFAVPERGKTRTGKGLIYLAYRGIHVESLRDAYLVRIADNFGSTIFFDVKGMWKKAEKNGTEDILLLRFEKGAKVPRVLYPERGPFNDTVYYSIFGPTIIGTNESVHKILESRAITINMPESSRRFENDITPESALPLKERLLAFRARHIGKPISDCPKPAMGRLGDIMKPLQQIIRLVKPEEEPSFLRMIREFKNERLIEKSDSLEAQILSSIIGLADRVENGILPVKEITDAFNNGKSERSQVTYQLIGRRLSAMGFKKAKTGAGASAILWEDEKIGRMKETYGLSKTSVTSEISETPAESSDVTDDTDVSDVLRMPL